MRPIHKACGNDTLRPFLNYIQVKDGFVNVTDAHILLRLPVDEVFPDGMIAPDEELYFHGKSWGALKFDKGFSMSRSENMFQSLGNGLELYLKAFKKEELNFKFPDVMKVFPKEIPNPVAVSQIAYNPSLLTKLMQAWGVSIKDGVKLTFYGEEEKIIVSLNTSDPNYGVGLIMPCHIVKPKP